jgi:hypothetical protein
VLRLRLFLDPGAGVCLWAADEATRARFGYAVDHRRLGLPDELVHALDALIADCDASLNWDDPGGPPRAPVPAPERLTDLAAQIVAALGCEVAADPVPPQSAQRGKHP